MTSGIPIIRQIAWISIIPQLIFMGLLFLGYYLLGKQDFIQFGALTYIAISFGLRYLVPHKHRTGMGLLRQENYRQAISYFQESYSFFKRYLWVDKYRFIALLSSSKMCYREMALTNIAYCYAQLGESENAIDYYHRALTEFPHNELAKAGLMYFNIGKEDL